MCPPFTERRTYTKDELHMLRGAVSMPRDRHVIPKELLRTRGVRGGRKVRNQREHRQEARKRRISCSRPAVPTVVMGNLRSLIKNYEELSTLALSQRDYKNANILIFTETWLTPCILDSTVYLDCFHLERADRTADSGKARGGGLAVYVNHNWSKPGHVTVKAQLCNRDIELLALSVRPRYLPREFTQVIIIAVYVPPSANAERACEAISDCTTKMQNLHPQALFLISGDFNHAPPSTVLPTFTQYITCPTRKDKTLDLFYCNANQAYTASPLPPLGRGDHNIVCLRPVYTSIVQREPAVPRVVRRWSDDTEGALRHCFRTTDWSELCAPHGEDITAMTECISDYINFCYESTVPAQTVRCFSNNKPWINAEVKALLREKKRAFRFWDSDPEERRATQKRLRNSIRGAKEAYKRKMERQLQEKNICGVWRSLSTMSGYKAPPARLEATQEWVNDLNRYFLRFDQAPPAPPPARGVCSARPCTARSPVPCVPASQLQPLPPPPPTPPITARGVCSARPCTARSPVPCVLPSQLQPLPSPPPITELLPPPSPPPSPTPPLSFTADEVKRELRRVRPRKAAGPDGISPRLLRSCAEELSGIMEHVFNLSLRLQVVPQQWKTSCVVPVPKTPRARDPSSFRPVALTSHLMKTLERLVLGHLRDTVGHTMDPLQFAYRPGIGVEDAIIHLLHRSLGHLETPGSAVRILFFDFSSAFNTIQPVLLRDKLEASGVDHNLAAWIQDYLTDRPQFVRVKDCVSEVQSCSVGAPQGTVLAPFLFTLYTADFRHNTDSCVLQKFSDDSAIIGLISDDDDAEYRGLTQDFVDWCQRNHLLLNAGKTKEMLVDFRRGHSTPPAPVNIQGKDIERVDSYKYLGVHLNNKLDWTHNTDALYKRGQSRLFLLRRLRSFGVRGPTLKTFYDSVVASATLYGVACWSSSITDRDRKKLDRIIKKSSSVLGCALDSVEEVGNRRVLAKLMSMLRHGSHPLQDTLSALNSNLPNSKRLIHPRCAKERFRKSFLPTAVRLFNKQL